jgi:hypothetical protein
MVPVGPITEIKVTGLGDCKSFSEEPTIIRVASICTKKFQEMTNLSALRIMMSSQLGNENVCRSKRDSCHACYSDLADDVFSGLLRRLRHACVAVAQGERWLPYILGLP